MTPPALLRKLLRDLWGMRGQALAIALVLASGVATYVGSSSTLESLQRTRAEFYQDYRFAEAFAVLERAPERLTHRIRALPGVQTAHTRIMGQATLEVGGFQQPVSAQIVSLPDHGQPPLNRLYLRAGRLPAPGHRDEVAVSEPFAEAHGLSPGGTLEAVINGRRRELTITGIALSPEFIYQIRPGALFPDYKRYGVLWMNRTPAAAAYDLNGAFNSVAVTLERGARAEAVIDRLDRLLDPYGGTGAYARADQLSHRYLAEEIRGIEATVETVPYLFLAVAAFLLNVVLNRLLARQRSQIALLKAFGYSNGAVARHYLGLVGLIVGLGAVIGTAAGIWMGQSLSALYREFFRFPFLTYVVDLGTVLTAVGVTAAAALAGTLAAVHRAARLPPAQAMQPEPPPRYRESWLERTGLRRLLDQPTRMILRHILSHPFKSAVSVLGIGLSVGILLVGTLQQSAIDHMIDVQFSQAQREDMTVTFYEPTSRDALYSLQAMPGVRLAEPFRQAPVRLVHEHRTERTAIQGFRPDAYLHRVLNEETEPISLPREGLVLSAFLADQLGVRAGDSLRVEVLEGARTVTRVPVAAVAQDFMGVSGYMALPALNRLLEEGRAVSGAYLLTDPDRRRAIFHELEEAPRVAAVGLQRTALESFYDTLAETILVFAAVNTVLAGIIAFGVVYNSARITLSERSRELASLRVLGYTRGETAYILLGELAILTLAAVPPGFLLGRAMAAAVVTAFQTEMYRFPLILKPDDYAFAALVVLVAGLLSGAVMAYRVFRLDMIEALKARE
ncbi:ABC transporter permease [Thiohalorhabdus sp. Cl-TMA]|uniref:ABC transporter permease n=1 Tax=Thiohalorhabdus methylotrophus TaxID=3242694 RepID=A0ABV4TUX1_9GAMM